MTTKFVRICSDVFQIGSFKSTSIFSNKKNKQTNSISFLLEWFVVNSFQTRTEHNRCVDHPRRLLAISTMVKCGHALGNAQLAIYIYIDASRCFNVVYIYVSKLFQRNCYYIRIPARAQTYIYIYELTFWFLGCSQGGGFCRFTAPDGIFSVNSK